MTKKVFNLVFLLFFFVTVEANAFVSGALGGGYRGALDSKIGSGPVIKALFHLDPIPLVPVSIGASFTYVALMGLPDDKKVDLGEFSLELAAWLPFQIFHLTPYVRAAVPIYNFFIGPDASGQSGKAFAGFHGTVGLSWNFLSAFSLFLEGGAGLSQYTVYDKEAGGNYKVISGLQLSF